MIYPCDEYGDVSGPFLHFISMIVLSSLSPVVIHSYGEIIWGFTRQE